MSDALTKVQPGMPLQIPARAYNAFVDAALDHQRRQLSTTADAQRDREPANVVLVRNESGADRSRFDILGITGPIITRADNAASFQSRIALRGETPTAVHAGRFVVLVDALPDGGIGRAYLSGACLVRVRMQDEAHTAADIEEGDASQLASGESGAASLLWVEPVAQRVDPAIAWALIRFGGGGSSSSGENSDDRFILALLTGVQRFSDANPDLPAYHWKEAEIDSDGATIEKPLGTGSKTTPSCDSLVVHTENSTFSVMADPALDGNLTDAAHDAVNSTMTFRITGTADTTHTVTSYRIQVGTGLGPLLRATYGDSGEMPPGAPPTFLVSGVPLATDVYIRVITTTSGAGTNHNIYVVQVGLNGAPVDTIAVTNHEINDPAGALLTTPTSGEYTGDIADNLTDLAIAWSTAPGATHYYVTAGTGSGDPNTDPTTWNLADHDVGGATTDVITGAPADGTPFYVVVWWRTHPSFDWTWNRWQITVTPAPDRRAINIEDINRILTESQAGLAGLTEIPDGSEDDESELDVPILVRIWRTTDSAGNDRFVCEHVAQEFIGEIVAHEPEWEDARYDVKLIKVNNTGAKDELVSFTDATGAAARAVTATNLAEDGTHNLPVGTRVLVRSVRGGDKPWITRYVFSSGGAFAVGAPAIFHRYVYDVDWNNTTCAFVVTYHWLEFVPVNLDGETYYLFKLDHATNPT